MSKPSSFSLRGRKALVAVKDERDASIVKRQFERLGIESIAWTPSETIDFVPDVALIDDEFLPLARPAQRVFHERCPVIALLGTETPSRLKLVLELDPASFLVKPLRSAGIYAALVMAFERNERTSDLKQQVVKLEQRLRSRRIVLAAVLHVMHSPFTRGAGRLCADPSIRDGAAQDDRGALGRDYGTRLVAESNGLKH